MDLECFWSAIGMALGTIAQISLSLGQQIMDFAAHSTLSRWNSSCKILCTTHYTDKEFAFTFI